MTTADVQIIVPIYNAAEALACCLDALKRHNATSNVVLIDDASTDPAVDALLQMHTRPDWQVIRKPRNGGFVETANMGLRLQSGHSLLLNSDAVVTPGWDQCLLQTLERVADVATVTPWSNNAEICSFPHTLQNNPLPARADDFAVWLQTHHNPRYPMLPTAVGFCMLVSAEAKRCIGYLDQGTFGVGYGEENDYSMRAQKAGMKNCLCDNAYVMHLGNRSFQEKGLKPDANSMQRLLGKHPEYQDMIGAFIAQDPLATLRGDILNKLPEAFDMTEKIHE